MNYSAFYDDVLIDCPRCPTNVALSAIRLAVIELCNKSRIWTYTTADIPVVASQSEYTLTGLTDSEIIAVHGAYFNDTPIKAKTQDWLDTYWMSKWQTLNGNPQFVTHDNGAAKLIIVPFPTAPLVTDVLRFRMTLRPTNASTSFDPSGVFANDFYEDIVSGSKLRLMMSPGKPYSNAKLAEYHESRWKAGINRARLAAFRNRNDDSDDLVITTAL